jgi:hypothetical protein
MAETNHKSTGSNGHETHATLPKLFNAALAEGAESLLNAQASLLADIEETVVASLRTQQETLRKVLDLMEEARNGGTMADHLKMQLAASEHCVNNGLSLWRDTTSKWSERALKRFESGQKTALAVADEERKSALSMVEKSATSMKGAARRASAEAA